MKPYDYEFNYQGMMNLLTELIYSAKKDFMRTYLHLSYMRDNGDDRAFAQAVNTYENAKRFFYSPLFCAASSVNGDEYIKILEKEMRDNGKVYTGNEQDV